MLSQTAVYALRAAIRLAGHHGPGAVTVKDLARDLDIPRNYLSKILLALARKGVVESVRGPGGGFRLARAGGETSLLAVVSAFDDIPAHRTCLLGRAECSEANACPVHRRWTAVSEEVAAFFRDTSLGDVINGGIKMRGG